MSQPSRLSDEHPNTIDRYRIDAMIGEGGMGRVYRAWDDRLKRQVAIKLVPAGVREQALRKRLAREATSAAGLSHASIVSIYDFVSWHGGDAIVMEWVDGESLESRLKSGPLELTVALEIVRQLAAGLDAAHRAGIVHRDLKAANVVLTAAGEAKILDFGLARLLRATSASRLTREGRILGTLDCMAPEQWRGGEVDERTDLFALGVLAYRLLTGQRPFTGETDQEVCARVLTWHPEPVSTERPEVPRAVSALVARLLAKEPEARPPTAAAVMAELDELRSRSLSGAPWRLVDANADHSQSATEELRPAATGSAVVEDRRGASRAKHVALAGALLVALALALMSRLRTDSPFEAGPRSDDAAQAYAEGLAALRRFDVVEAGDKLRTATTIEPSHAYSWAWRANAERWYRSARIVEGHIERAVSLAGDLPESERIRIRALGHAVRGEWQAALDALDRLTAEHRGDLEIALEQVEAALEIRPVDEVHRRIAVAEEQASKLDVDRVRIDLAKARAFNRGDDYARALEHARDAQGLVRGHPGLEGWMAKGYLEEAKALQGLGENDRAQIVLNTGRQQFMRLGNQVGATQALELKAFATYSAGDLILARELYGRARATWQALGDLAGDGRTALVIGGILLSEGRPVDARNEIESILPRLRVNGFVRVAAAMEDTLGSCLLAEGRVRDAEARYAIAAAEYSTLGELGNEAIARNNRGEALFELGDLEGSRREHTLARARAEEAGAQSDVVWSLFRSAHVSFASGDWIIARRGFEQADRGFEDVQEPGNQAQAWLMLARLDLLDGDAATAERHARAAEEFFREYQLGDWAAMAQMVLAEALAAQGGEKMSEARTLAEKAHAGARDIQTFRARVSVVTGHARSSLRLGGIDRVALREELEALEDEISDGDFILLAADVQLSRALFALETEVPGARRRLESLAETMASRGLGLWSLRARAALGARLAAAS